MMQHESVEKYLVTSSSKKENLFVKCDENNQLHFSNRHCDAGKSCLFTILHIQGLGKLKSAELVIPS